MKLILSSLFFGALILFSNAETVTITNKKGQPIKVKLLKLDGSQLSFQKQGSYKKSTISLDLLSPASAKLVREKLEAAQKEKALRPPLNLQVSIKKNNRRLGSSYYMKTMNIEPSIGLQNKDIYTDANPCNCVLLIIGEDQSIRDQFAVLGRRNLKITPDHNMVMHPVTPSVRTIYDSDNQGYNNVGGFKYIGYILLIKNSKGEVFEKKTNIARLKKNFTEDHVKALLKIKLPIDKSQGRGRFWHQKTVALNRNMMPL